MTKICTLCLFAFIVTFSGCRLPEETRSQEAEPQRRAERQPAPNLDSIRLTPKQIEANGIRTTRVAEQEVTRSLTTIGRVKIRAGGEAEVFSPFPGKLVGAAQLPRIGDFVTKGRRIADVEEQFMASERLQFVATTVQLQASIEQAQQEVELKRTESDRARQLYDGGAIALRQLQTAEFELRQAETKLEGARQSKKQYDAAQSLANSEPRRTPIRAPIAGTVMAVDAALGQQVDPSKSLLTVADLSTIWVEASVHERDLPQVRNARQAEITIPRSAERSFTGQLVTIGNVVDVENRTLPVMFSVANRSAILKIEMFVEARIVTGPSVKALLIPSSAVLAEQGTYSVYVEAQSGVYRRRMVELGQRKDAMVIVTSGLQKGEKVVSIGAQSLRSESRKGEIPVEAEEKEKKRN